MEIMGTRGLESKSVGEIAVWFWLQGQISASKILDVQTVTSKGT